MLACQVNLRELDLRGNPVEKKPKMRDQILLMGSSIGIELFIA
jgi:hypothetical protein